MCHSTHILQIKQRSNGWRVNSLRCLHMERFQRPLGLTTVPVIIPQSKFLVQLCVFQWETLVPWVLRHVTPTAPCFHQEKLLQPEGEAGEQRQAARTERRGSGPNLQNKRVERHPWSGFLNIADYLGVERHSVGKVNMTDVVLLINHVIKQFKIS